MVGIRHAVIVLAATLATAAIAQKPHAPDAEAGQSQASAADTLPPGFRGRISYRGTHEGEVTRAGPPLRSFRTRDILRSVGGGRSRQYGGAYNLDLTFNGNAVTGRYSGTGGVNSGTVSGTRNGDRCRLIDDRDGTVTEAICTRTRFFADVRVERGRDTTVVRLEGQATQVVDALEEERERVQAAAAALAERRRSEAEAQRAAEGEAARLRAAPRATPAQVTLLERTVRGDLPHWGNYTFDAGSLRDVRVVNRSGTTVHIRGNYSFNGGTAGWVRGEVTGGRVTCLEYSDAAGCNPPRSAPTAVASNTRPVSQQRARSGSSASASQQYYRSTLAEALLEDSGSWSFNRLEPNSAFGGAITDRPANGGLVYRLSYRYNGSSAGWIEGYFVGRQLESIRYQDNPIWSSVRTQAGRQQDQFDEAFRRRQRCIAENQWRLIPDLFC